MTWGARRWGKAAHGIVDSGHAGGRRERLYGRRGRARWAGMAFTTYARRQRRRRGDMASAKWDRAWRRERAVVEQVGRPDTGADVEEGACGKCATGAWEVGPAVWEAEHATQTEFLGRERRGRRRRGWGRRAGDRRGGAHAGGGRRGGRCGRNCWGMSGVVEGAQARLGGRETGMGAQKRAGRRSERCGCSSWASSVVGRCGRAAEQASPRRRRWA
jgi:hypothetical protein